MVYFYQELIFEVVIGGGEMETKNKKEKPKYNMWQNSVFVLKTAWERDKVVLFVVLAQIFLIVALSTIALFLPKTVIAQITRGGSLETLILTILGFTVVTTVLSAIKTFFDNQSWVKRSNLRNFMYYDMLDKLMTTDYANLEKKDFNDHKTQYMEHVGSNSSTTEMIYSCFEVLGTNILGFIVFSLLLVSVNPVILIITAATTIVGYFVREWANKWQFDHHKEEADFNGKLFYLSELGSKNENAKDIRLFGMVNWLNDINKTYLKLAYDFEQKVETKHFIADATDCVATFLREGIAYGYLVWQVLGGNISADMFVLYFGAIGGFSSYIMGILRELSYLSKHSLNYCRIREFLEYPNDFNYENGESIAVENDNIENYTLEVKNVSFKYSGSDKYILENVNLKIEAGEKLAIVGLNGAGKTTLVKLLCGLYDPTEGEILLNGKDIKVFNRKDYYKLFTAVFQEFLVLPKTIGENVAQVDDVDIDKEKLYKCLELADIDKKINSLPDKENSLLRKTAFEEAVELSGGELQKLMLARAIYKNSPILILDEPTAALDPIAESKLYQRYNQLSENKTSIYISHRLASTRFCDRIILLGEKGILECGTHEELLEQRGKYFDLFEIQSKYYKDEEGGGVDVK